MCLRPNSAVTKGLKVVRHFSGVDRVTCRKENIEKIEEGFVIENSNVADTDSSPSIFPRKVVECSWLPQREASRLAKKLPRVNFVVRFTAMSPIVNGG